MTDTDKLYAPASERAVIGSMLLDRDACGVAVEILSDSDFGDPGLRAKLEADRKAAQMRERL